jgi:hypothetical protein
MAVPLASDKGGGTRLLAHERIERKQPDLVYKLREEILTVIGKHGNSIPTKSRSQNGPWQHGFDARHRRRTPERLGGRDDAERRRVGRDRKNFKHLDLFSGVVVVSQTILKGKGFSGDAISVSQLIMAAPEIAAKQPQAYGVRSQPCQLV